MARLHIMSDPKLLWIGRWVSRIAARVADGGLDAISSADPRKIKFTEEFRGFFLDVVEFDPSIPAAEDQMERAKSAMSGAAEDDRVYLQFHFDRTVKDQDNSTFRIVNVVIPDFTTKLVRDGDGNVVKDGDVPLYDLNRIAEEEFGFVVMKACE